MRGRNGGVGGRATRWSGSRTECGPIRSCPLPVQAVRAPAPYPSNSRVASSWKPISQVPPRRRAGARSLPLGPMACLRISARASLRGSKRAIFFPRAIRIVSARFSSSQASSASSPCRRASSSSRIGVSSRAARALLQLVQPLRKRAQSMVLMAVPFEGWASRWRAPDPRARRRKRNGTRRARLPGFRVRDEEVRPTPCRSSRLPRPCRPGRGPA